MEFDVATRAALKLALLPPGGVLLLLLLGWIFARRFFGRFLILLGILSLYVLSTPVGVDWLGTQVETIGALTPAQAKQSGAKAILVLMADVRHHNPEYGGAPALSGLSLERLDYALYLHRQTKLPIVLSGGSVNGETPPLAELGAAWLHDRAGVKVLDVEAGSRDTWENVSNSAETLAAHKIRRVLLVTHAFHMPRAMLSAQAAGIDAVAAPFGFLHASRALHQPGEPGDWLPRPGYLGRSYLLLHEMAGLVWYGMRREFGSE